METLSRTLNPVPVFVCASAQRERFFQRANLALVDVGVIVVAFAREHVNASPALRIVYGEPPKRELLRFVNDTRAGVLL
jgi:hypothetical protein